MTEAARALVTGQMIADIVIVGLRGQDHRRRREARAAAATDSSGQFGADALSLAQLWPKYWR
jgi:hypothetical protein